MVVKFRAGRPVSIFRQRTEYSTDNNRRAKRVGEVRGGGSIREAKSNISLFFFFIICRRRKTLVCPKINDFHGKIRMLLGLR